MRAALAAVVLFHAPLAGAQGGPAAPDADAPGAVDLLVKEQARAAFRRGVDALKAGKPGAALPDFLRSRALFPTKNATLNALLCLRQLDRLEEELELLEALLREFPTLTPDEKGTAQRKVAELRAVLGTIAIDGAPIGAAIVIDGRNRADFPAVGPLYVPAGAHVVRVYKEGFEPFEGRVDVAGGQVARVNAKLRGLLTSGRLRVLERGGRALDVVVDGIAVGQTPWEGPLAVGAHVVALRGVEDLGTQPAMVRVTAQQVTLLTLEAEVLDAPLLVRATPAGSAIAIDSVEVAHGIWEGRLRSGPHRLEVAAEGFVAEQREIHLEAGQKVITIELERDPDAALWRKPSRVVREVGAAIVIAPMMGGDVASACPSQCRGSRGVGTLVTAYGGYELASGVGFGVSAGYLFARRSLEGRPVEVTALGGEFPPNKGEANETLQLSGILLGAAASRRTDDERFPLLARIGVGGFFARVGDARRARFPEDTGTLAPELVESRPVFHLYLAPEVRLGLRITDHVEVGAGLSALLLIALSAPKWGEAGGRGVVLSQEEGGYNLYAPESLADTFSVILAPGLSARYDF